MKKILYYDNSATTAVHPEVISVITDVLTNTYGNPSSLHSVGQKANEVLTESRKTISKHIGCNPKEIIFTSGACEANSLAIKGFLDSHKNSVLVTTKIEHKSILELCRREKYDVIYVSVDKNGRVNKDELLKICKTASEEGRTILTSIQAANNEIGTIQDIKAILSIVHKYNGIFHTDATQLFPYYKIDVSSLGIDMLSMSGQKIGAPKGIGFLYVKNGINLNPIIYGSQMEYRRGGTENVAYIAGLAKGIELLDYKNDNMINMQYYFFSKLSDMDFDYKVNGSMLYRLPSNINISFNGIDGEALAILLDCKGICVSTSSACNSASLEPSATLEAIGLSDKYIHGTIRITLPKNPQKEDINFLLKELKESIEILNTNNVT